MRPDATGHRGREPGGLLIQPATPKLNLGHATAQPEFETPCGWAPVNTAGRARRPIPAALKRA